jgi:MoxR-like ATPase
MDQFYMAYEYTANSTIFKPIDKPIIHPDEFPRLRSQAEQVHLSTLVRSYILSILIAMRLHPKVVSTSISSRAVKDIRNLVQVLSLREGRLEKWTNAECVPKAVELCTSFRLQIEEEEEDITYQQVLRDVIENVRAPF